MRITVRTASIIVAAITVLTLEAGPAGATPSTLASRPTCGADDCSAAPGPDRPCLNPSFSRTPYLVGIGNKLAALLDELPSAGVARPCIGG